ncbi:hypothetical protein V492_00478 [Pseudogymnoascus sp. VKM F-4246]|nr:hypothetical protein V492_00478 [Pseudogymnoascus sp. VKM F-4246]
MRSLWPLVLLLIGVVAQNSAEPTASEFPHPPKSWISGEVWTTFGQVEPTGISATVTTTIQRFPTGGAFVATGPQATPTGPDKYPKDIGDPGVIDGVPGYLYGPLFENAVQQSTAYTIDITETYVAFCWYPISGNYGRLPRILFYVTIAAAVLLRSHLPWLYLGALAASLTYSGSAAIHACLLIWRGPAWGELDLHPLLGILSVSCIIMVPLINWSSTIRTAGRPDLQHLKYDERPKKMDEFVAASRIILIFWSFLVTLGFLSIFIGLQLSYRTDKGRWSPIDPMVSGTFSCAPRSGVLNVTVGQPRAFDMDGVKILNYFTVTKEFLDANNCVSPCANTVLGPALFRSVDDLVPVTMVELGQTIAGDSTSSRQAREAKLIESYTRTWSYIIVYILLQGAWTICFGRNKPSETRAVLYHFFSRISISGRSDRDKCGTFQRRGAQAIALSAYLWSVFVVIIAVPLLLVDVTLIELYVRQLPQSESYSHVGAWTPYASTALVLIAAALAKSYDTLKAILEQSKGNVRIIWLKLFPGKTASSNLEHDEILHALHKVKNILKATGSFIFRHDIRGGASREWTSFYNFCANPEKSYDELVESRKIQVTCTCPQDYECEKHKECAHRVVCADEKQCKDCKACGDYKKGAWTKHECTCKGPKDHITEASIADTEGISTVDRAKNYMGSSHSSGYLALSQDTRFPEDLIPQQALVSHQSPVSPQAPAPEKVPYPEVAVPQQASVPRRESLPNPVSVPKRVPVPKRTSTALIPR